MPQEPPAAKKVVKRVVRKTVVKRPVAREPVAKPSIARPSIPKLSLELGRRVGAASRSAATAAKRAGHAVGAVLAARRAAVRAYRIPRLEPTRASAIVGTVVGMAAAAIAALALTLFSAVRGVATGGGTWGSLAFVVVAVAAGAMGEYLLAKFGVPRPRVTSFLGLCLTLITIMAVFIGAISGPWAWLLLPALGALTFAVSHRLLAVAVSAPRED